jgi:hypothetical protein
VRRARRLEQVNVQASASPPSATVREVFRAIDAGVPAVIDELMALVRQPSSSSQGT